jgi:hypothetical protein
MAQSTDGGSTTRVNFIADSDLIDELERTKAEAEYKGVLPTGSTMSDTYRDAVRLEIEQLREEIESQD